MEKPSFAVSFDDKGKATLLCMSGNADEVLRAYKAHDGSAAAYLRPVASKRKGEASGLVFREDSPTAPTPTPKPEAPTAPTDEPEQSGEAEQPDIEALKALAAGDGRKAEVKEAKEKLAELGIIV
jgi:hypothetical protein